MSKMRNMDMQPSGVETTTVTCVATSNEDSTVNARNAIDYSGEEIATINAVYVTKRVHFRFPKIFLKSIQTLNRKNLGQD